MVDKQVTLIAAMDRNRVIGRDGEMPWHLPVDLRRFKLITLGKSVIMGRKTWESIGRPLPGRQNIVISRRPDLQVDGCELASSLQVALRLAQSPEVMIIGGGEIYQLALPFAARLAITEVDALIDDGQVWFPEIEPGLWQETSRERRPADSDNPFDLEFVEYRKQ